MVSGLLVKGITKWSWRAKDASVCGVVMEDLSLARWETMGRDGRRMWIISAEKSGTDVRRHVDEGRQIHCRNHGHAWYEFAIDFAVLNFPAFAAFHFGIVI